MTENKNLLQRLEAIKHRRNLTFRANKISLVKSKKYEKLKNFKMQKENQRLSERIGAM